MNKIPYFELKVVKVKKEREDKTPKFSFQWTGISENNTLAIRRISNKPKGNWVNGENLDEIKFPCFCSYKSQRYPMKGKRFAGMIFQNENYYYLFDIHDQYQEKVIAKHWYKELRYMIREYDIHILRGKVIIWEEE